MHPQYLSILACPETHAALELTIYERSANGTVFTGELTSAHGAVYPIIRGIPRFVGKEHYAASFGYEWTRWPRAQFESENVGKPMAGHTTAMWEKITGWSDGEVAGKLVVDYGCGPGRFLDVVRRKGGRCVGIDLSLATEAAYTNFADDPDVLIVQGDILHPPFAPAAFDAGYSIGVFHHTPDPPLATRSLAQRIKPGGKLAVCVYENVGFYAYPSVRRCRAFFNTLPKFLGYRPALWYAQMSAYVFAPLLMAGMRVRGLSRLGQWLQREWITTLMLPDMRWRVLDIFDAITPAIASTHSQEEVRAWLAAAGCTAIAPTPWCATSLQAMVTNAVSMASS